jgi:hypothetical protein
MHRHRFVTHANMHCIGLPHIDTYAACEHLAHKAHNMCNLETHANLHQEHGEDQGDEEEEGVAGGRRQEERYRRREEEED